MNTKIVVFCIVFFMQLSLKGQVNYLPIAVPDANFVAFNNTTDTKLNNELNAAIKANPAFATLVKKNKLCVGVLDISNPYAPKYASVNGKNMMYAASLPKIAVLLAVMDAVDKGEIEMTPAIDEDLQKMIRYSNNQASTRMIDLVGYEKIASVLQNPKYEFYDRDGSGGLWVGKRYAAAGARYPEPIKGLSHAATVDEVCKFYYMLAYGKLINCEKSEQMLSYMSEPGLHHKFVNCLDELCPQADVYRKSGSWKNYHADSVLVIGKEWRSYILVALVEDPNGEQIIRQLLPLVEKVIN
jgi:beta-lactamase class A